MPIGSDPPRSGAFWCIDHGVPAITVDRLRAASTALGARFRRVDARAWDPADPRPVPGDALYCAASSRWAARLEAELAAPGVSTVWRGAPGGPHHQRPLLVHAGVPTAPHVVIGGADRGVLRRAVDSLGGFPLVAKVPGGQAGVGVMLAESLAGLYSLADLLAADGRVWDLMAFVRGMAWRAVVVGDEVVAAHPAAVPADDFRSGPGRRDIAAVPPVVHDLAVPAAVAIGASFGGVDLIVADDGRAVVLEVNTPCFFAEAEARTGADVAGRLVAHLLGAAPQP
jgi:hypothetical protein